MGGGGGRWGKGLEFNFFFLLRIQIENKIRMFFQGGLGGGASKKNLEGGGGVLGKTGGRGIGLEFKSFFLLRIQIEN